MTPFLYRLGQACARRRLVVLGAWLVVALVLGALAKQAGTQTTDDASLPGTDSQRAADVLSAHYGTNPLVLAAPRGARLTDARYASAVDRVAKRYEHDRGVLDVVSPLTPAGRAQLSRDERIGYLSLELRASPAELTDDEARRLFDLADAARAAGLRVAAGGYLGQDLSQPGSADSEAIGLLAAVVVLLATFGTVVAMGLPILTAIFGLGTGLSLIALLSQVAQVPSAALDLATMIGLGVGIDYSLFIVTRHRQQLTDGLELRESVARATATAGGAVVFAGATVTIALCSLLLARIPIVTQLGYVSAVAVLVAVLAAITLLPAALAWIGPRIDALPLRPARSRARTPARPSRDAATRPPAAAAARTSASPASAWTRWARGVAARPWPALVAALLVIAALALPARHLSLGQSDTGQLPTDTTARQAYDLLSEGFGPGFNGPLLVAVEIARGHGAASATQAQLAHLGAALAKTPGVAAVSPPLPARDGRAALLTVTPRTAPSDTATETLVRELRDTTVPDATRDTRLTAYVGGSTAGFIDLADGIGDRLPLVIAVVLGLSFLLLLVAFRSVPVALKAVLMNLLSIGAAFGIVTYVFTHAWSSELLGIDGASPIVSFVPLMMFAILFGLSMDYEVFLMTHVRERWQATGDAHEAVVEGLAGTARVITSAALIMVAVFCAFLLNGSPTIKQFGLGMAAAVAVDATIIRCLLVPALLALLGRRAWWMPRWLARATPPLSIEGEAWFERRAA
jgi:putative drug exporter of the RND superfamily